MSREMRGHGTVYQRGQTWWVQFCLRGQVYRESAHSPERKAALKLLKQRLGESGRGQTLGPVAEKVRLGDMTEALLTDYRLQGNRSLRTAKHFTNQLVAFFGKDYRALDITADRIKTYVAKRQEQGLAPASINRETACLVHMFNLMVDAKRLSRDHVPTRPRLKEAEARQGFLEPADFVRLRDALPGYLKEAVSFLYLSGWRLGAMKSLQWIRDVKLGESITLQAEFSKNKRFWTLPLAGELLEVIQRAEQMRISECPYVFHHDGEPLRNFEKAWATAAKAIGRPDLLVHDLRRSCARNLVRAGVPERVAMNVTGHSTRSMFDRYDITSGSDLQSAMQKVSAYVTTRASEAATVKVIPLRKAV
jgi:integrase